MDRILSCAACGTKNRIPADKGHLAPKCGKCGAGMRRPGEVVNLTDQIFHQAVEQAVLPVLVDFYSPTCGPCQMLAPIVSDLADAYGDRMVIAKLDTSRNRDVPGRFAIRGVPTLLLFKNGQVVDQLVGAQPRQTIEQHLLKVLRP